MGKFTLQIVTRSAFVSSCLALDRPPQDPSLGAGPLLSERARVVIHLYGLTCRPRLPFKGARPHPLPEENFCLALLAAAYFSPHLQTRFWGFRRVTPSSGCQS